MIFTIIAFIFFEGYFAGKIIMSLIWSKFWIMISYDGLYVYSGELFPTTVR